MKRIILGITVVLAFLSVSCKDKDDDHPTKPRVDYTALAFKNLVAGKTFNMQAGMSSEFGDTTGAITFNANAIPTHLAIKDEMDPTGSLSSVKLYKTPATNKGIYSVLASNVILSTDILGNDILGNVEMYVGIEITSSGTVLYETSIRGIVGQSTISSSDIDWNKCFISGLNLDNQNITEITTWFPSELIGTWLPKTPYTNDGFFDGLPYAYVEFPYLRILSSVADSNDIVFYTYSDDTFSPSYSDAVNDANAYDGNSGYTIIDSQTHLFKLGDNEYILTISFQKNSDTSKHKTRIYDIIYVNDTSIRIINAKDRDYGVIYQDLVFEKATTTP